MAIITQIYDGFIGMKKKTTERTRQSVAAQKNAAPLIGGLHRVDVIVENLNRGAGARQVAGGGIVRPARPLM